MLSRIVLLTSLLAVLLTPTGTAQVSQIPTPQNLKATVDTLPSVHLVWDAPAGLWAYKVYRADGGASGEQTIGVAAVAQYTDRSVVPGGEYTYTVAAAGLVGGTLVEGTKSKPVSVIIPASTTQGVIAGRITDDTEGTGVPYAQVMVTSVADTTRWVQVITGLSGAYSVTLDPGTYTIFVQPPYSSLHTWQAEWYDNASDREHATPVAVAAGATQTINIAIGSGPASTALLQIIHNAADPAAATVDVYLDSTLILNDFAFRHATPFVSVPAGKPFAVSLAPGNSTSVADAIQHFTVTLDQGKTYVVVACGVLAPTGFAANPDGRDIAFALFTIAPALTAGSGGNVQVAILHGATDAPAVDIVARGVGTLVDNARYGDIQPYLALPPSSYIIDVKDTSGTNAVASFMADLRSLGNQAAVVFASGFLNPAANANGAAFGLFAALPSGLVVALPPEGTVPAGDGVIIGSVVDAVSGLPLAGAKVTAYRTHHAVPMAAWTRTGSGGTYTLRLPAGAYYLHIESPLVADSGTSYGAEWYDDVRSVLDASAVVVTSGDTAIADVALTPIPPVVLVGLSGKVTDANGTALADAHVVVMRSLQETVELACAPGAASADLGGMVDVASIGLCHGVVWVGTTDGSGGYKALVRAGRSYVVMAAKAGYIPEYFNDKPSPLTADRVMLGSNDTTGIDLALASRPLLVHAVSGSVKDPGGNGIPSRVVALPVTGGSYGRGIRFCSTDSTGTFRLGNISAGRYVLLALPYCGHAPAFYKAGAYGVLLWKEADVLDVQGEMTGIEIGVVPVKGFGVAWLSGHVRSDVHVPLAGVSVVAASAGGDVLGYAVSDAEGAFTITGIASGPVTLTADLGGHEPVVLPVTVPDGSSVLAGIDLTLKSVAVSSGGSGVPPATYGLSQNYPNPFNPSTVLAVDVPAESRVTIAVFNVLGQEVIRLVDGVLTAGRHPVAWGGRDRNGLMQPSGLYLCRLEAREVGGQQATTQIIKMMLVR